MTQSEIAEASKQDAAARALRAAGKHVDVNTGDMGNGDEGASKKEREKKLHRMTRKKRRRILAEEADKREEEAEKEELRAQGLCPLCPVWFVVVMSFDGVRFFFTFCSRLMIWCRLSSVSFECVENEERSL